jgi:hypothetical protein
MASPSKAYPPKGLVAKNRQLVHDQSDKRVIDAIETLETLDNPPDPSGSPHIGKQTLLAAS